jgi:biopolymer transport protein ExbB
MNTSHGIAHFLGEADFVGWIVLVVLVVMSVSSWYFIVTKGFQSVARRRRSDQFLRFFWEAPDLDAVRAHVVAHGAHDPFSSLMQEGFAAVDHLNRASGARLIESGTPDDFLTRALKRSIDRTTARLESGLTVLASVGSAAPFVGLFGTVWGIYHALLAIGVSGQGTLDKVAGPVGEALIMTAGGLAVAIPAVLGYNALVRSNRIVLAELDSFAHEVFAFMSIGHRASTTATTTIRGAQNRVKPEKG